MSPLAHLPPPRFSFLSRMLSTLCSTHVAAILPSKKLSQPSFLCIIAAVLYCELESEGVTAFFFAVMIEIVAYQF